MNKKHQKDDAEEKNYIVFQEDITFMMQRIEKAGIVRVLLPPNIKTSQK